MSSDQETAPAQWKQEWASPPIIQGDWFDVRPVDAAEMLLSNTNRALGFSYSTLEEAFSLQHSQCPMGGLDGLGNVVIAMGGGHDGAGF
jgi:hypothetical protein